MDRQFDTSKAVRIKSTEKPHTTKISPTNIANKKNDTSLSDVVGGGRCGVWCVCAAASSASHFLSFNSRCISDELGFAEFIVNSLQQLCPHNYIPPPADPILHNTTIQDKRKGLKLLLSLL
jgi:hypothetical protein